MKCITIIHINIFIRVVPNARNLQSFRKKKNKLKKKKKCNTSLCVVFVVLHKIHEGIVKLRGSIKYFIEL